MFQFAKNILLDLIRFYSVSGEELSISMFIYDMLIEMGLPVKRELVSRGVYNIIVNDSSSPTLVIASHIDTVKIFSLPKTEDRYIYGTGSVDAKASVAAMLLALRNLKKLPDDVSFAFLSDEEDKGSGSEHYLMKRKPRYALIMEPTELKVCFAGYGALEGTMLVKGKRMHPSISYTYPDANAIMRSIDILQKLRKIFEEKHMPFTVFAMNCGSEEEYSTPNICMIHFDIGVPPRTKAYKVFRLLSKVASEFGFEFFLKEYSDPFETTDNYIRDAASEAYMETFKKPISTSIMVSWTDANNFALYGSKPIIFGPGSLEVAHSDNERVLVDDIVLASSFVLKLITKTVGET